VAVEAAGIVADSQMPGVVETIVEKTVVGEHSPVSVTVAVAGPWRVQRLGTKIVVPGPGVSTVEMKVDVTVAHGPCSVQLGVTVTRETGQVPCTVVVTGGRVCGVHSAVTVVTDPLSVYVTVWMGPTLEQDDGGQVPGTVSVVVTAGIVMVLAAQETGPALLQVPNTVEVTETVLTGRVKVEPTPGMVTVLASQVP
jgi:hypothetical protein